MARFLACSDIHNNVNAVRQLRAREVNDYDAVIVAGDIGSEGPDEVFDILRSFECPVFYVFGNWDRRLEYNRNFGADFHHLHLTPFSIGGLSLVGESIDGIDPDWEASLAAAAADRALARQAHLAEERAKLRTIIAAQASERTIVVSPYRLTRTQTFLRHYGASGTNGS